MEIRDMIISANDMKNGMPPILGGAIDQPNWFMECSRFYRSECNRIESEAYRE